SHVRWRCGGVVTFRPRRLEHSLPRPNAGSALGRALLRLADTRRPARQPRVPGRGLRRLEAHRLPRRRALSILVTRRRVRRRDGELGLVQGSPHGVLNTEGIRPYRADDLADCLQLTRQLLAHVDLGYVWTSERLAHQLDYAGLPRTIVLEDHGHVGGFVNYYRLDFAARNAIEAAVTDLICLRADPRVAYHRVKRLHVHWR